MQTTIERYSRASRQKIYLNKSCIQFGATTRDTTKNVIVGTLGMEMVTNVGKYIGLSANWGRSKREALRYLKERIMKKIHGWKTLFLDNGGKEVLIKAVITEIPS